MEHYQFGYQAARSAMTVQIFNYTAGVEPHPRPTLFQITGHSSRRDSPLSGIMEYARVRPRAFRYASGFPVSGFRTRALIIEIWNERECYRH